MIDLYYANTPEWPKITLFLEEVAMPYTLHHVDIGKGDQFKPEFLAISPNNKIPAIVDNAPADGGEPLSIFESGAILIYLAEKSGRLLSHDLREKMTQLQWLFWQVGDLVLCLDKIITLRVTPLKKYLTQSIVIQKRPSVLYQVLESRLAQSPYLGGNDYSIADIATYTWARYHDTHHIDSADYPAVEKWLNTISQRPAAKKLFG